MKFHNLIIIFSVLILGCKSNTQKPLEAVDYAYHHELRPPSSLVSSSTPTLLLLHGYGSNEKDLLSLAKHIDPQVLVICPRAPLTLMDGKYSWYNLNRVNDKWSYQTSEVLASKDQVLNYLDQLTKGMGIAKENIYMGGFSQGAIMSLTTGLLHPSELGGIISLSGKLYPEVATQIASAKDLKDLKVFISHGLKDEVLLAEPMKKTVALLETKGLKVSKHWYPSKHTISNDNFNDLLKWIGTEMIGSKR